jgi:aspartate-semialdehyde dehydrogenase
MEEFEQQVGQFAAGEEVTWDPGIFDKPIVFDCLPRIDSFLESCYTKEEMKMVDETKKIMGTPEMAITATAVRVPVVIGHSESINLELESPLSRDEALEILRDPKQSPGVTVIDDPQNLKYPTQADCVKDEYKDDVLVGRVREDNSIENGLNLWCVSDNLRKGAATNTVQIAEGLIERGLL